MDRETLDAVCVSCAPHPTRSGRRAVKMTLMSDGRADMRYFYVPNSTVYQASIIERFNLPTEDANTPTAVGRCFRVAVAPAGKYETVTLLDALIAQPPGAQ